MFSRTPVNAEMIDDAARMLRRGQTRSAVITHLRVRWGLDTGAAEQALERAIESMASVGAHREVRSAAPGERATSRRRWCFPAIRPIQFYEENRMFVIIGGMLLGFMALMLVGVFVPVFNQDEPDDSAVTWIEETVTVPSPGVWRFQGRITNTTTAWEVRNPRLIVKFYDGGRIDFMERRTNLSLGQVRPGQTRFYSVDIEVIEAFRKFESDLEWGWLRQTY